MTLSRRIYELSLRLYPRDLRTKYGAEMADVFEHQLACAGWHVWLDACSDLFTIALPRQAFAVPMASLLTTAVIYASLAWALANPLRLNAAYHQLVRTLPAPQTQAPNITGTWQIEYHDKNGIEVDTPTVTFKQSGGHLEGVFGDQNWKIEGTIADKAVTFSFHPPQHTEVTVRYQGTLESPSLIRGTMKSELQSGTFTAVRE